MSNKRIEVAMAPSWSTYMGSTYGVVKGARMTDLSLTEFAGLTGLGFHLIIQKRVGAAGVTVYNWTERHMDALERIGILSELFHYEPGTLIHNAAIDRAQHNIKASIDNGVGVIAWAIDTGEFGIINGYDDRDGVYLVDGVERFNHELGSDPMLYENLGKLFPGAPYVHYQIPIAVVPYDCEVAFKRSLAFYVHEMEKPFHISEDFQSGLLAYDSWIRDLKADDYDAFGLRYNLTVYAEAKMFIWEYMQMMGKDFQAAARLIDVTHEIWQKYESAMSVLEQDFNGGQHLIKGVSKAQATEAARLLAAAKELELLAMKQAKNGI